MKVRRNGCLEFSKSTIALGRSPIACTLFISQNGYVSFSLSHQLHHLSGTIKYKSSCMPRHKKDKVWRVLSETNVNTWVQLGLRKGDNAKGPPKLFSETNHAQNLVHGLKTKLSSKNLPTDFVHLTMICSKLLHVNFRRFILQFLLQANEVIPSQATHIFLSNQK